MNGEPYTGGTKAIMYSMVSTADSLFSLCYCINTNICCINCCGSTTIAYSILWIVLTGNKLLKSSVAASLS